MPKETDQNTTHREIKSNLFAKYFEDPQRFISLYNAVANVNLPLDTPVEFKTLENVIFYGLKNDIAGLIDDRIIFLIEHQSSINENMTVRLLLYVAAVYEKLTTAKDLYSKKRIKIPRPEFIVLYNGKDKYEKEKTLKLSDSFMESDTEINSKLELEVKIININYGQNIGLVERSKPLKEYSYLIEKGRSYERQGNDFSTAVKKAMSDCIKENIMAEYLKENGSEVFNMLTAEFDMDALLEVRVEEARDEGRQEERVNLMNLFQKLGASPELLEEAKARLQLN